MQHNINPRRLYQHFKKIYPECSEKELEDLTEAIKADKYWRVDPVRNDAIYVVALTRAKIPLDEGYMASATYLKQVAVSREAARFSRRGRVLAAVKIGSGYVARTVLSWPVFLKLFRASPPEFYDKLKTGSLPPLINRRNLARTLGMPCTSVANTHMKDNHPRSGSA